MNKFLYTLKSLLNRNSMESSMREEMQQHIEMQAAEFEAEGMSPTEALRKARKAFGNQTYLQEDCRASWGVRLMDDLTSDVRFAIKQLRKHPLFTAVAVLSLGIGIGVNLTLFNAFNALLFKPLPLDHPEQLREINTITPPFNGYSSGRMFRMPDNSVKFNAISYTVFKQFRDEAKSIADVFCWASTYSFVVEIQNTKRTERGLFVSDNYFESLHITPLLGQAVLDENAGDDASRSTWISELIWEKDFERNPDIIGKTVTISHQVFVIVGVIPAGLGGLEKGESPNFFFPLSAIPAFNSFHKLDSPEHFFLQCGARLKNVLYEHDLKQLLTESLKNANVPYQKDDKTIIPEVLLIDASRGIAQENHNQSRNLIIPMIMSGILLLVSCVNLAGLQFSRNYKRIHELNIRAALGARRGRLIRQLVTETLILCLAGSVNGIILALLSYKWLNLQFVYSIQDIDSNPDLTTFAMFAGLISLTTVLVGLYPALRVTRQRHNLHTNQKSGGAVLSFRTGKIATTLQIICAISLIYTAFLFSKTIKNLYQTDLGFDHSNLLLFSLEVEDFIQSSADVNGALTEILDHIRGIAGVENAACSNLQMLSNWTSSTTIPLSEFHPESEQELLTYRMEVTPTFFETLNIPIILGTGFDHELVSRNKDNVIISKSFADKAFQQENPIGRTFRSNNTTWTIIGICPYIQYYSLRETSECLVYSPMSESGYLSVMRSKFFYVRTLLPPMQMAKTIEKSLGQGFPGIFVEKVRTLDSNIDRLTTNERSISILSILFSGFSVLLTCIGLFAQTSFETTSRNHEIGVRLALGANPKRILRHLLKHGLAPIIPGSLIGVPLALLVKHSLGPRLFGMSGIEFTGLALSLLLIIATTLLAVSIPSIRSSRLDPSEVLRNE